MTSIINFISKLFDDGRRKRINDKEISIYKPQIKSLEKLNLSKSELKCIKKLDRIINEDVILDKNIKSELREIAEMLKTIIERLDNENEESEEECDEDEEQDDEDEEQDEETETEEECEEYDEEYEAKDVEIFLDKMTDEYKGYDNNHPMMGVSWSNNKNTYQIKIINYIDTYTKNLETACLKSRNAIYRKNCYDDTKNAAFLDNDTVFTKLYFQYKDDFFITYWYNNKFYYDIRHIIGKLKLNYENMSRKYSEYSKDIQYRFWFKNDYGGYMVRELIDSKIMFTIYLNSSTKFGKEFKNDVSDILVKLQEENKLMVNSNGLTLKNSNTSFQMVKNKLVNEINTKYNFNNLVHFNDIVNRIRKGLSNNLLDYVENNKHVMYVFVLFIHNYEMNIIIKIGYTHNLIERMKSLKQEYKCDILPLGFKNVRSESDEKKFHDIIHISFPDLEYKLVNNGKKKIELYYYNPCIMDFFDNYLNDINTMKDTEVIKLNKENIEIYQEIESRFPQIIDYLYNSLDKTPENSQNLINLMNIHKEIVYYKLKERLLEYEQRNLELTKEVEKEKRKTLEFKIRYLKMKLKCKK